MIALTLVGIGTFILQDGLASIAFYYPKEPWRWNQTARLIRAIMGGAIIVIGYYVQRLS